MIIWITGVSASGKSTVCYKVLDELGIGYKNINDRIPYHSFGDIITVGRYSQAGKTLNGLDGVMVSKDRLQRFIDKQHKSYRHILIEGNKFLTEEFIDHLLKYELKIFHLNTNLNEVLIRSSKRSNGYDKRITLKERKNQFKKYEELYNKPKYKSYIEVRENLNIKETHKVAKEILELLKPINNIVGTLKNFL